jgi:hypothetical protein
VRNLGGQAISMTDSDANTFQGNTFSAIGNLELTFEASSKVKLNKNSFPSGTLADLQGNSSRRSDMDVYNTPVLKVALDDFSTARFRDNNNKIFDPDEAVYTTSSTSSSLLTLTSSNTGGTSTVVTRTFQATPASGKVYVNPTSWGGTTGTKSWNVRSSSSSVSVAYIVGNLAAGRSYTVKRGSSTIATLTADSVGKISFSSAPGSTSTVGYTVTAN